MNTNQEKEVTLQEKIAWVTHEVDRQLLEVLATATLSPDCRERLGFCQRHMQYLREESK